MLSLCGNGQAKGSFEFIEASAPLPDGEISSQEHQSARRGKLSNRDASRKDHVGGGGASGHGRARGLKLKVCAPDDAIS